MIEALFLDDDIVWRELLNEIAKDIPVPIYRIYDRKSEFIAGLQDEHVWIAIIDHHLGGGVTGLDILLEVKEKLPRCRCIILSATQDAEVMAEYINAGRGTLYGWVMKDPNTAKLKLENILKRAIVDSRKDKEKLASLKSIVEDAKDFGNFTQ